MSNHNMNNNELIFHEADALLRMTLMGGQARVLLCRTTRLTQQAADIHQASDAATAAMGRLLSAAAMLSCMIKEERGSVTVTVSGDGAGGRLTVVGRGGQLKIAVENPQAELTAGEDGRQYVAGFVGRHGKLTVIKDMGQGEPYIGITNLVSGELGMDFAEYFTMSEQTPSLVALGCLNQADTVLSSGGILIQAMPGCEMSVIEELERREPFFRGISRELYDRSLRELAEFWFQGMELDILAEDPLTLQCDCSRERMARALRSLGAEDRADIAASGEDTVMACHFCRDEHRFTPDEVRALFADQPQEDGDALH